MLCVADGFDSFCVNHTFIINIDYIIEDTDIIMMLLLDKQQDTRHYMQSGDTWRCHPILWLLNPTMGIVGSAYMR